MKSYYTHFKKTLLGISALLIATLGFAQCEFGNYGASFTQDPNYSPNFLLGTRHYNNSTTMITHLGMEGRGTNAGVQMAIYSDNAGVPGSLLGYTALQTIGSGNQYFPISPVLLNVGYYWIMAIYDNAGSSDDHTYMNSSVSTTVYYTAMNFGDFLPLTFSGLSYTGPDFKYWASAMDVQNINIFSCGPYTWSANGQTYNASTFQELIIEDGGTNGCHLLLNLDLQVLPAINNTVTVNGNTMSADLAGNTYQWLDCDNNQEPVSGATSQTFSPAQSGNFAVQVTTNDCISISPCTAITVNTAGISEDEANNMTIYPNPASFQFSIINTTPGTRINVIDMTGKVIISDIANATSHTLTTDNLSNGVYIVQLEYEGKTSQKKLAVNK